jgi:hypothetical protein
VRYERERPGELVHVDIKKQGKIPAGGGWRVHGRAAMPGHHRGAGYDFIHAAVDDRSRVAYAEILPDERRETVSAFMSRALGFFADRGVSVERVLTDNGSCYRSKESGGGQDLYSPGIRHPNGQVPVASNAGRRTLATDAFVHPSMCVLPGGVDAAGGGERGRSQQ